MKFHTLLFAVGLLFCSCTTRENLRLPVLKTEPYIELTQINVDSMIVSMPLVLAYNVKDTIDLSEKFIENEDDRFRNYEYPEAIHTTDSIQVLVDAKRQDFHVTIYNYLVPFPNLEIEAVDSIYRDQLGYYTYILDSVGRAKRALDYRKWYDEIYGKHFEAYPVYIYNYSKSVQKIDNPLSRELSFILEAKNGKGEWKPIEYIHRDSFVCGFSGQTDYLLKPGHFMVSYVKKYRGGFNTKMRVKFKSYNQLFYSNEFPGSINEGQFNGEPLLANLKQRYQGEGNKDLLEWGIQYSFLDDTYPFQRK